METSGQSARGDVTGLLRVWSDGEECAFDRLLALVYDDLQRMARRYVARERPDVSLQATDLVNELCLRLLGWNPIRWQNRAQFYGVSAQMMRRRHSQSARGRAAVFFGGLSMQETAEMLGLSLRTVQNDWAFARAWLYRALTEGAS